MLLPKNSKQAYESYDKDLIKRELNQVKSMIGDVRKKIDTHDHIQYEKELDQFKNENIQLL